MVDVVHSSLTGADDHEPKGTEGASKGQVYVADGVGGGIGSGAYTTLRHTQDAVYDYNDANTAGSPIALTLADTLVDLTNDGLGPNTSLGGAYSDIANLWDTGTNRFSFTGLSQFDTITVRYDVIFTTGTANTAVSLEVEFGIGGTPFSLPVITDKDFKTTGVHRETVEHKFYLGSTNVINNPARIRAKADKTGTTVIVNGWAIFPSRTVTS